MLPKNLPLPLVVCGPGAYLLYCLAGLVSSFILAGDLNGAPMENGHKLFLLVMATRLWPYPMLQGLGWRANPESLASWLAADAAGLLLVVPATLLVHWILGPERRKNPRCLPWLLGGLAVLLLVVEFAVVAAIRITNPSS